MNFQSGPKKTLSKLSFILFISVFAGAQKSNFSRSLFLLKWIDIWFLSWYYFSWPSYSSRLIMKLCFPVSSSLIRKELTKALLSSQGGRDIAIQFNVLSLITLEWHVQSLEDKFQGSTSYTSVIEYIIHWFLWFIVEIYMQ